MRRIQPGAASTPQGGFGLQSAQRRRPRSRQRSYRIPGSQARDAMNVNDNPAHYKCGQRFGTRPLFSLQVAPRRSNLISSKPLYDWRTR